MVVIQPAVYRRVTILTGIAKHLKSVHRELRISNFLSSCDYNEINNSTLRSWQGLNLDNCLKLARNDAISKTSIDLKKGQTYDNMPQRMVKQKHPSIPMP